MIESIATELQEIAWALRLGGAAFAVIAITFLILLARRAPHVPPLQRPARPWTEREKRYLAAHMHAAERRTGSWDHPARGEKKR